MNPKPSAVSSQASADSTSASSKPAGPQLGRSNSIPPTGLFLLTDFPEPPVTRMCAKSADTTSAASSALPQDFPARTSASPAADPSGKDYAESEAAFSMRSFASSKKFNSFRWCLKTLWLYSIPMTGTILPPSSGSWRGAGMWDSGACLPLAAAAEQPTGVGRALAKTKGRRQNSPATTRSRRSCAGRPPGRGRVHRGAGSALAASLAPPEHPEFGQRPLPPLAPGQKSPARRLAAARPAPVVFAAPPPAPQPHRNALEPARTPLAARRRARKLRHAPRHRHALLNTVGLKLPCCLLADA